MKLSKGFTLSEVLITLGIIGVVAALSVPALQSNVQKQKVGPSLRKFINTLENANLRILEDAGVDIISDVTTSSTIYAIRLTKHIAGTASKRSVTINKYDGSAGSYSTSDVVDMTSGDSVAISKIASGKANAVIGTLYYDINGANTAPNRLGKDIFAFRLTNKGKVIPVGGQQELAMAGLAYSHLANRWNTNSGLVAELRTELNNNIEPVTPNRPEQPDDPSPGQPDKPDQPDNPNPNVKRPFSIEDIGEAKVQQIDGVERIDVPLDYSSPNANNNSAVHISRENRVPYQEILTAIETATADIEVYDPIKSDVAVRFSAAGTDNVCNSSEVTTGLGCAASVAENNWKVIYKY